jgi:hypothetical protein
VRAVESRSGQQQNANHTNRLVATAALIPSVESNQLFCTAQVLSGSSRISFIFKTILKGRNDGILHKKFGLSQVSGVLFASTGSAGNMANQA